MELKIKNGIFYVLEAGDERGAYDSVDAAVGALQTQVKEKQIDPAKVNVVEVNLRGQKWEIKSVPWAQIAMELLKKGGK